MKRFLLSGDRLVDVTTGAETAVVLSGADVLGRARLHDLVSGQDVHRPLEDIRRDIAAGRLEIRRDGQPRVAPTEQHDPVLDKASAAALRSVLSVLEIARSKKVTIHVAFRIAAERHAANPDDDPSFPSRATFYRYLKCHRKGLPLLVGNKNKGNRAARYPESVSDLVRNLAQNLFLNHQSRWTLGDLVKRVNDVARDEHLVPKGGRISQKYVRKVVTELTQDPEAARMLPHLVPAARSVAHQRLRVDGLLQRVEQDALHLPFVVQTPFGVSSNVWVVHAIDCATSAVVGWRFVIGSPRESDGLMCIETIFFSKADRVRQFGIQLPAWQDVYGLTGQLVFDNGPETSGQRILRLTKLGVDIVHLKSRHPHLKPYIERLNRSLKEALQTLPGCTRKDGQDGTRDPVALGDKLMAFEELQKWVLRWYFESWANHTLKRFVNDVFVDDRKLGDTPNERCRNLIERDAYAYPLPPERHAWFMTRYERDTRTLARTTGITYKGFNFRGINLDLLLKTFGENPVEILYDPEDFRSVYVEVDGRLAELVNIDTDERTPAYTFDEAKRQLDERAAGVVEHEAIAVFRRDVHERSLEDGASAKKVIRVNSASSAETARLAKEAAAIERARSKPQRPAKAEPPTKPVPAPLLSPQPVTAVFSEALDEVEDLPLYDRKQGPSQ